jgi:hypothetical protein
LSEAIVGRRLRLFRPTGATVRLADTRIFDRPPPEEPRSPDFSLNSQKQAQNGPLHGRKLFAMTKVHERPRLSAPTLVVITFIFVMLASLALAYMSAQVPSLEVACYRECSSKGMASRLVPKYPYPMVPAGKPQQMVCECAQQHP